MILGGVDKGIAFRDRKDLMIGLLLKQFGDIAPVRPWPPNCSPARQRRSPRCRGELVVNPMGQFADKGPFIQVGLCAAVLVTTAIFTRLYSLFLF
jgi:hypothetical protein